MADTRSSLGINLIASLLVYAIVGLPFLAFIQPLVALPQIDNFKWGTREAEDSPFSTGRLIDSTGDNSKGSCEYTNITERNQKSYSGLRQKEKFLFLAMVYILNGAVLFGIGFLAGGDSILAIFSCLFVAAQILQATFGVIRNVHLNRQQKTNVL
eukprot:109478_1